MKVGGIDSLSQLGLVAGSQRTVAWLGGAVIAAIVGLSIYDMVSGYREAVAATGRELRAQSRVIAEQTARSVQAVDVMLRHLSQQMQSGTIAQLSPEELHRYLKEQAVGLVQVDGLVVFNADGTVRAVSNVPPDQVPPLTMAADPPFARLRSGAETGLMVDNAMRSPGTGRWVFPIGRRVVDARGAFAGVVGAPGRVEYFQQFYRAAFPEPGTRIVLLHRNGTLLARHPGADALLGRRVVDPGSLLPAPGAEPEITRGESPLDGSDRFAVVRAVPDYPLVVVVTRDAETALAAWRAQAAGSALRTLALAGVAAGLLAVVWRQLSRLNSARRSLEDSRQRYALAAAGADDGIWDWDLRAGTAYESRRARELQGLPLEPEMQPLAELEKHFTVHPDDAARRAAAMKAHLEGETADYEIEYRVRRDGGDWRWIHVRALCIRDGEGRATRIAGSVSDIDDRKRTEVALRESEERFALAVEGSDDGIWDLNYVTDTAFYSPRGLELLGLPNDATTTSVATWVERVASRVHPDDRERRTRALEDHLAGRAPAYEAEYRALQSDGQYRWRRARGVCFRDPQGRLLRFAGSISDIDARKRTEEALRQSEERYALAMAGSRGGHWVWDTATDELFVSGTVKELFGVPPELNPTTRAEYSAHITVHPDDRERVARIGQDLVSGRETRADWEYRIVRPAEPGGARWVLSRAQRFDGPHGVRIAGVSVDITERKLTEEALRESEQRFAVAVAGSDDGIWDFNYENRMAYNSARGRQILGVPPDRDWVPLDEWWVLIESRLHPDDVERRRTAIADHLAGRTPAYDAELRLRHGPGDYRWVRVHGTCVRGADGQPIRMAGSVSDIDSRKRAEEALRRSEERYQLAVDGSNEGLWDWDLKSDMLFLSPRAQQLTFAQAGEPLRPRAEWIERTEYHPDDIPEVRRAIVDHLTGRTPHFVIEYRLRHHGGDWHWYRQRGIALRDADGHAYRVAGSMEDISERKRADQERDRLEGQLRQAQKLEAIGTLAGGIAHDFNNILSAILGYGELVQRDAAEGSAQRRHIDAAMAAGARARSLVERILAFSRSGIGERLPVHVESVVDEALDAVAATLPAAVVLERRLASGQAGVMGDPTQIHQVVLNLCTNAVQAMRGEGRLTVTLRALALDEALMVATRTLDPGRYVELQVADTGSGIAPAVLERIFDPFFTTKEVGVGTGLGLSLVHGIVADLGGGIAVQSTPGEGSTFTVLLPWQCEASPASAEAEAPVAQGAGETILLVDDEEALVRLSEELLAELGYEPVGFVAAADALAALRDDPHRFDAVLSDESMPGLTGSELAREVRALRPDLPVVLMSGFVNPVLLARAREAGVAEVMSKPLAARDIARALAAALAREPAIAPVGHDLHAGPN